MMKISAKGYNVKTEQYFIASIVRSGNVISLNEQELSGFDISQWPEVFEHIMSGTANDQIRSLDEIIHNWIPFDGFLKNPQIFVSMIHLAGEINNPIVDPSCRLPLRDIRIKFIEHCLFRDKLQSDYLLYVLSDHLQNKLQKHIQLKNAVLHSGHVYELKLQADDHEEIIYYHPYHVPTDSTGEIAQNDAGLLIKEIQKEYSQAVEQENKRK